MDAYTERLQEYAEEVLASEQARIAQAIREAADRIIEQMVPDGGGGEDPLLDREQAAEEFGVPYWKVRDVQLKRMVPTVQRGRKVFARRSDLARVLAGTA